MKYLYLQLFTSCHFQPENGNANSRDKAGGLAPLNDLSSGWLSSMMGSAVVECTRMYSNALRMYAGIGGGVGKWSPVAR
jgi:hypothetical protein